MNKRRPRIDARKVYRKTVNMEIMKSDRPRIVGYFYRRRNKDE